MKWLRLYHRKMCLIFCLQGDKALWKIIIDVHQSVKLLKMCLYKASIHPYTQLFHIVERALLRPPLKKTPYRLMRHPHLKVSCSGLCHLMMDWVPPSGLHNTRLTASRVVFLLVVNMKSGCDLHCSTKTTEILNQCVLGQPGGQHYCKLGGVSLNTFERQ